MFNAIFQRPGSPNGRGTNTAINPASLALLSWLAADYDDQQRHYVDPVASPPRGGRRWGYLCPCRMGRRQRPAGLLPRTRL